MMSLCGAVGEMRQTAEMLAKAKHIFRMCTIALTVMLTTNPGMAQGTICGQQPYPSEYVATRCDPAIYNRLIADGLYLCKWIAGNRIYYAWLRRPECETHPFIAPPSQ